MTVSEIAEAHGVSRQTVHAYRSRGTFPKPVEGEGSTRPRFREDEVAEFFAANPKRPGRRTDRESATEGDEIVSEIDEGETVTVPRGEFDTLLAVATLYLGAFTDDDRLSATEAFVRTEVVEIVEKYGRRY